VKGQLALPFFFYEEKPAGFPSSRVGFADAAALFPADWIY